MSASDGNTTEFRIALGAFATGVTVVTTLDDTGEPVGVTASSFNSVSLDPRLVLWSLAKKSLSRRAFCSSGHFAIHVLADTQEELSNRFARSGADKFGQTLWARGALGSPLLAEYGDGPPVLCPGSMLASGLYLPGLTPADKANSAGVIQPSEV